MPGEGLGLGGPVEGACRFGVRDLRGWSVGYVCFGGLLRCPMGVVMGYFGVVWCCRREVGGWCDSGIWMEGGGSGGQGRVGGHIRGGCKVMILLMFCHVICVFGGFCESEW
jgi:hypothetical protein